MVLQVAPDARQVRLDGDAEPAQRGRRADAREHQQLRGDEGAGGEQHLAIGAGREAPPVQGIVDADGAIVLDDDAVDRAPVTIVSRSSPASGAMKASTALQRRPFAAVTWT